MSVRKNLHAKILLEFIEFARSDFKLIQMDTNYFFI